MNIKEIYIYGYGKFENFRLSDLGPLHVIYGKNEAGKSTLMSFIHSILFGFPTRQQSELRYEPKSHAKYGGRLVLDDQEYGEVTIERVKGKAAGDVTVTLADGTRGGEELLTELLRGMDKATYQAIFSFNIHSLQNVHQLKGEDLNRYLFSASAVGSDRLFEAEALFRKEQEKRFRPHGKKPVLNQQLERLRDLSRRLTGARQENDRYEELLRELATTDRKIAVLRQEVDSINKTLQKKRDWNRAYPFMKEKQTLKKELASIGNPPFPRDGIRRFEQLESEKIAIDERLARRMKELEQLQKEMTAIRIREDLLAKEDNISYIIDRLPSYRQEEERLRQIEMQEKAVHAELSRLWDRIGYRLEDDEILSLNVGFSVKDRILRLANERNHLLRQKEDLEKEERDVRTRLEQAETFLQGLKERRLPVTEKAELEKIVAKRYEAQQLDLERQWIDARLQELQNKAKPAQKFILPLLILILFTVFTALYIFFTDRRELVLLTLLIFTALLFPIFWKNQDRVMERELRKRKKNLDEKLKRYEGLLARSQDAQEKLEADRQLLQKIEIEQFQMQHLDKQFNDLISAFARWEEAYKKVEQEMFTLGRTLKIPTELISRHLLTAYELLVQIKEKTLEKQQLEKEWNEIKKNLLAREQALEELQLPITGESFVEKVQRLKIELDQEQRKREELRNLEKKYEELLKELEEYREKQKIVTTQMERLFQEAKVGTKEEFYRQAEKVKRRQEIEERLQLLEEQLVRIPVEATPGAPLQRIEDAVFQELKQKREDRATKIEKLERKRAHLEHAIRQIEEGGTYSEILHAFHQEKYQFNERAKEWAVYRLASYILARSTAIYKEERLPKLLQRAESLFQKITDHEYEAILLDPERDEFFVRRADGLMFSPQELSQATQEQLYISIRLALTFAMNERIRLPILIDDAFVNFDEERLQQMIRVIKETDQQILLFTCHRRVAEQFARENVLDLANS